MAKVSFTKLGLKVNQEIKIIKYNEQDIEVKVYLPMEDKIDMISRIVSQSVDDNGFYNPLRVKFYTVLEVVETYTNINFTEKMKENSFKLYDLFISTGFFNDVIDCIGEEWKEIQSDIQMTIKNIYEYKNSMAGILEMVTTDYSNMNLDAQNIQKALGDPENLTLLKDVMTKLG